MIKALKRLFQLDEQKIFRVLGRRLYLVNGKSYFYNSDNKYLVDNEYLKIGFGKVVSGYGDWGFGYTHAMTSPLKVTVDKNLIIKKIETDSFYNSKESQKIEEKAKKLAQRLRVGQKLYIKNEQLKADILDVLNALPVDRPISWDMLKAPHMKSHYIGGDYE